MISEVHKTEISAWLRDALKKVTELAELPEDWDGYGSRPIQQKAYQQAANLLSYLSKFNLPAPQIFPVPGGGVQFEWQNAKCGLEIEALPDGSIEYLIVDERHEMREGSVTPGSFIEVDRLVNWFNRQMSSVALV